MNRLMASKLSEMVHREFSQIKFSERPFTLNGNGETLGESTKSSKGGRKKNKNLNIRLKANGSPNLKESLLDFMVVKASKTKRSSKNYFLV